MVSGEGGGISTAVAVAALGAAFALGALLALGLALRTISGRHTTARLESIEDTLRVVDERVDSVIRPRFATEAALGRAITETLDLREVLQRTLAAAEALDAVDGSRVTVSLPDGREATETSGQGSAAAPAFAGPPDGSRYTRGIASWETDEPGAIRSALVVSLGDGSLMVCSRLAHAFDGEAAAILSMIARRAEPAVRNALEYLRVQEEAATDLLTGLGSARAFSVALPRELEVARRHGRPLCVIQIDLDDFAAINNTHPRGYAAGDDVLRGFGERVRTTLRASDSAFRNSGGADEFFLVLPETTLGDAKRMYARLRADVSAAPFGDVGPVTMSGGLAQLGAHDTRETLRDRAGDLVRIAKSYGKDRLVSEDDVDLVRQ